MKARILLTYAALFSTVLFFTSCTTVNVSNRVSYPVLSANTSTDDVGRGAMVFVEELSDQRDDRNIGDGPSGKIEGMGSATSTVRDILEDTLKKSGFNVTDSAPIVLQTQLKKWNANFKKGVPSGIESDAEIVIQVYDPANRLAYTGSYNGNSQLQQSTIDDSLVREALSASISQVMQQIVADKQLLKLISSF